MSDKALIAKNTGWLFGSEILNRILSFFLIIAMARYLGDIGLGIFAFATAYIGIFQIFSDFGISWYLIREVAKDKSKADAYFSNTLTIKLILSTIITFIAIIGISFSQKTVDVSGAIILAAIYLLLNDIAGPFRSLFSGYEKLEYYSIINIVERIISLTLGIILLISGFQVTAFISVFIVSYAVALACYFYYAHTKFQKVHLAFDFKLWKHILTESWPFWFAGLLLMLYYRIDTVMLTYLTDYSQVGWYNAAVRVSTALHFIPFAIVGATFPAMSKFFVNSTEHLKSLYRKSLYYLIILALPMAMGGMILSSRIIHFVFGEQFAASGIIFAILIWAEAALFLNAITTNMLNAMNKQKLYSLITLCWAIFNIVFNYILITRIGYTGAAYTTMFTEFGLFVSTFAMLHYFGMKLNIIKLTWKPIAATLVMTATILLLQSFHFIIIIIASVVVYGGVLLLLKALDEQDKDMIKEMFNKLPFRPKTVDE